MTHMPDALRTALRPHRRRPAHALAVVATLAVATGATTAVFAVVNATLLRALPFASPHELVWVTSVRTDNPNAPFTLAEFMDYRAATRTLTGLAAYANWSASLAGSEVTERLTGARMSANAFAVLGVRPAAGRLLQDSDDRPDAPRVMVLSYRLWQRRFAGAPDAVGRTERINGEPHVVVGVLPAQLPLPVPELDVVTALAPERDPLRHVRSSVNFLRFFGRLRPGVDRRQAQAELTAISQELRRQFPKEYARKEAVRVVQLHEALVADHRRAVVLLFGAVVVVMAAALANLVSLALVRAHGRRAELALRAALGASRPRLARALALEALALAGAGSALGLLVAETALRLARHWGPASVPRLQEAGLDAPVLLFAAALAGLVTLLLALAPLATLGASGRRDGLRGPWRGALGDGWSGRVRSGMAVGEIAAAVALVLAALALVQNLRRLHELRLGFEPDGVFQARVSLPPSYRTPQDVARFHERFHERIARAPGVERAGVVSIAPLSGLLATVPFAVEGAEAERERTSVHLRLVSPGYAAAVRMRVREGRGLAETDEAATPPVALVSAALSDAFLGGRPLGRRILIDDNNTGPRPVEVVGVVENVTHVALDAPPALDVYLPLRQVHADGVPLVRNNQFWMVRTSSDPGAFAATFAAQLRAVDPDAALSGPTTMRGFLDRALGPRRFNLGLIASFALVAVLLAVSGLYGLVSCAVTERVPEIGLRIAIGATLGDVRRMILGQAARLGLAGSALGLALAAAVRPLAQGLVQDAALHPALVAGATSGLLALSLLAAWLPARRASRIDPVRALRAE